MESAQREILIVLLGRVFEEGLISERTYHLARDIAASQVDFPDFLWFPVCAEKEADADGCTQASG